ncbi:hypothetical protein ACOSP7_001289 [Xanthoceras sorbifolium]|uniref:Uncharacterized protein n=1 Tax=Xanthoceras sorbifolium TaxID=99658 RepID=A0ABQ8ILZ1_9ROSI|nr:hypothetical protein JRO89_XS01G0288300 [Xanthoceras sorbifolium]
MGCFLGCFGSSKDRKRRKQRPKLQPRHNERNANCIPVQSTVSSVEEYPEKPINISVSEVGVKTEEQSSSGTRKKVTFDANVRTYEHVFPEEVASTLPEKHEVGKIEEAVESLVKSGQSQSSSEASSITSSSGSYPSNHRYQNCRESDDEEEELDFEDSELDDDDDDEDEDEDGVLDYDDMYEDDGIVQSKIAVAKEEIDRSVVKPIRGNGTARDRSAYVHSVLNPVENLTQWKALKTKGKPQLKQQKENFALDEEPRASFSLEPSFKELSLTFKSKSDNQSIKSNQEIAVDASLSNWLSSSEATPINKNNSISLNSMPEKTMSQGSNSPWSQEDRPILGALTLEEIKQFSASSSPRKSPTHSPDEMAIIGTVGTYWTHTGNNTAKDSGSASSYKGIPNTTSKYREDKRVNWHSTPFETRLERALNRGAAEGFSTQY